MKKISILVFLLMFVLTACAPATSGQSPIEVSDVSVQLFGSDTPAAGYMIITNNGDKNDRLLGITADFAQQAMLHQSSVDANGVASMKMVMAIDLPAGGQIVLRPGGYHLMLMGLKVGLKVGDTVTLVLQFEQAGTVKVSTQVTNP
jgi:copper(I)-binding protein